MIIGANLKTKTAFKALCYRILLCIMFAVVFSIVFKVFKVMVFRVFVTVESPLFKGNFILNLNGDIWIKREFSNSYH